MKIVVRMLGGLGNQLFQYAYARYLTIDNPNLKIYLDIREYETYKVRRFDLDLLKLNNNIEKLNTDKLKFYDITRKLFHLYQYLYRKFNKRPLGSGSHILASKGLVYSGINAFERVNVDEKDIYIYGYFQDIRIVNPIRSILIKEFTYNGQLCDNVKKYLNVINGYENSLAVSIRCGEDYISSGWPVCSIEYYKNGLKLFMERNLNYKIFIFADDIEKVKKEFDFGNDVIYIEGCSAIESLELLRKCKDFIISNSSFAWWGAYLSESKNKTIVAPKKWFNGLDTIDSPLYLENEMIIVE